MPVIDLTRYIVASTGTWTDPSQDENLFGFTRADTVAPQRLLLRWAGDFVALAGPLSVRVTVQAENLTVPIALVGNLAPEAAAYAPHPGAAAQLNPAASLNVSALARSTPGRPLSLQASTIYSYTLDIAAGQAWPFSLSEQLDALRLRGAYARYEQLGNNLGFRVLIEPAFEVGKLVPVSTAADLPCDFAVADQPNTAQFFPVACEPCEGSVIGLPPSDAVSLVTPPAEGGCVRTRFFNGMFITREDLETEQRYHRLKSKLHNRAAGTGVVWGFNVGRQGSAIWVLPGYGVDCCGNDLALTTTYKVETASLLADPAAAGLRSRRGLQRMHLLLEYVECPSDPRPVHGDVCAPEASRCEMSRIRESVRLRLVPPRDYEAAKDSAPLTHFLNEVRELRARYPLGEGPAAANLDQAPFVLRIHANFGGMESTISVRPSPHFDRSVFQPLLRGRLQSMRIELVPDPLWGFVAGTQTGEARRGEASVPGVVQPAEPITLALADGFGSNPAPTTFTLSNQNARLDRLVFRVSQWQAQTLFAAEDEPTPSGELILTVLMRGNQIREVNFVVEPVAWRPLDLAPAPCAGEPCAAPRQERNPNALYDRIAAITRDVAAGGGGDALRAGVGEAFAALLADSDGDPTPVLPWLHPDPGKPASGGDPKALILAALGGWLAQMLVRERVGAEGEVLSARRMIAQEIYRTAWQLLFGVSKRADPAALGAALKRLFEAWCCELLWKGPQCCGEPHGVVIGCAAIEGGAIRSIDPFGGRRHVVHYPLLAHWGAQFGIAPLDVIAARFFSRLCCVAALPAVAVGGRETPAMLSRLGAGYFAMGDPRDIAAALAERQIAVATRRQAGMAEMIAAALMLSGTEPEREQERETERQEIRYAALVLSDFVVDQTVMLLTPM